MRTYIIIKYCRNFFTTKKISLKIDTKPIGNEKTFIISVIKTNYSNINDTDREISLNILAWIARYTSTGESCDELALKRISYFRDYRPRECQSANRLVDRPTDWVPE